MNGMPGISGCVQIRPASQGYSGVVSHSQCGFNLYALYYAPPGRLMFPIGVVLHDEFGNSLIWRFLDDMSAFGEEDGDILGVLAEDLDAKVRELGANALMAWMTSTLANTIRISDPIPIVTDNESAFLDEAFEDVVGQGQRDKEVTRSATPGRIQSYGLMP